MNTPCWSRTRVSILPILGSAPFFCVGVGFDLERAGIRFVISFQSIFPLHPSVRCVPNPHPSPTIASPDSPHRPRPLYIPFSPRFMLYVYPMWLKLVLDWLYVITMLFNKYGE